MDSLGVDVSEAMDEGCILDDITNGEKRATVTVGEGFCKVYLFLLLVFPIISSVLIGCRRSTLGEVNQHKQQSERFSKE